MLSIHPKTRLFDEKLKNNTFKNIEIIEFPCLFILSQCKMLKTIFFLCLNNKKFSKYNDIKKRRKFFNFIFLNFLPDQ